MAAKIRFTRFRAYQLGEAGSSFSYFDGEHFTLIEARLTDLNMVRIDEELELCGIETIHTLHITSWDNDHCSPSQLSRIFEKYNPLVVEYPGYEPHTESGVESLRLIIEYKKQMSGNKIKVVRVDPDYIKSLDSAKDYGYADIVYHPKYIDDKSSNNNSTVKQFRCGSFNVLSLGDVECSNLSAYLRRLGSVKNEVDVMVLAHHGADNGFTNAAFIKMVRPRVAIATSNYGNQHDHPRQEIRNLLYEHDVRLYTTKTGDVIVHSTKGHRGHYSVKNLISDSDKVSSGKFTEYVAKKMSVLDRHVDNIRSMLNKKSHPR